jgi:RNA polymerase sigma factor (sigma-70 family)
MSSTEDIAGLTPSDAELLRIMATGVQGTERVRKAWAEFYTRHHQYILRVCTRSFAGVVGNGRIEEIVHDTFVRAYERAGSYVADHEEDQAIARRQVRAWMGKISENLVKDYFRREPTVSILDEDTADVEADNAVDCEQTVLSNRQQRIEEAFDRLSEREQEVLRSTSLWYKPGEKHQRMPNSVMKNLSESLRVKPSNVRQIRARAVAKLKQELQDLDPQDTELKT